MLFNSLTFFLFFPPVLLLTTLLRRRCRARNLVLLVASYIFYAHWDVRLLGLLVVSSVVDYFAGLFIAQYRGSWLSRGALWTSIGVNLGILFSFKYCDFFAAELFVLMAPWGISIPREIIGIAIPVGVSFYTFQTMSYTIDVFREDAEPCRNFLDFALFVSFFPQLVAGPIERASHLLRQFRLPTDVNQARMMTGVRRIFWGLFKKVVIADNLAYYIVDPLFDPVSQADGAMVLIAAYAFAFQIYSDFSGYCDIAIGCAQCLGFDLCENFHFPYFATDPSDFWRRWHISLSTWLRDYLYIPLGGNRGGKVYRNLLVTMILGGLWHGANWTFVAWGVYHGMLLVIFRRFLMPYWRQRSRSFQVFFMFHLTCLGWLLFRAANITQALEMLGSLVTSYSLWTDPDGTYTKQLLVFAGPLIAVQLLQQSPPLRGLLSRIYWPIRAGGYGAMLFVLVAVGRFGGDAFIYFQF